MLNIAPEPFMIFYGADAIGNSYTAADFCPELFAKWKRPVIKVDLCVDIESMPPESYDVVMHNHVLEHLPCDISKVLSNINRLLVTGGFHIFSAPIVQNTETKESLSPDLTGEQRRVLFGQEDHLRMFGDKDFLEIIGKGMPLEKLVDVAALIGPRVLRDAAIPEDALLTLNSSRIFAWKK